MSAAKSLEDPKGGRLPFAYDGEGRVTAVTNQRGVIYHLIRTLPAASWRRRAPTHHPDRL